jgi:hypothetical protein
LNRHGKQFGKSVIVIRTGKHFCKPYKTYSRSYSPNATPIKTIVEGKMLFFLRNRSRQRCQQIIYLISVRKNCPIFNLL